MDGEIGTTGYVANEMYDRINYGARNGGGLYTGNSVLAANAHADGTGLGNNVKNLSELTRFGFDNSLEVARESRNIDQFGKVTDNQFRAELRGSDQLAALSREVANNARVSDANCCKVEKSIAEAAKEQALCCCDAKLEAQKNACDTQRLIIEKAATTDALILAVEARGNLDKLAESRAENTYLKTVQALGHNHL